MVSWNIFKWEKDENKNSKEKSEKNNTNKSVSLLEGQIWNTQQKSKGEFCRIPNFS